MAKAVSNENLARFLKKCDERYAKAGKGGGGVSLSNIISHPESLPTATADSPDLVEVGGVLYRKKFSNNINLIGTWIFNDVPILTQNYSFSIEFISGGVTFYSIIAGYNAHEEYISYDSLQVYGTISGGWEAQGTDFKTIQITDISSLSNEADFISWLTANATKQGGAGGTDTYSYVAIQDA